VNGRYPHGGKNLFLATERDRNGPQLLESAFTKAPPSNGMVELFFDLRDPASRGLLRLKLCCALVLAAISPLV